MFKTNKDLVYDLYSGSINWLNYTDLQISQKIKNEENIKFVKLIDVKSYIYQIMGTTKCAPKYLSKLITGAIWVHINLLELVVRKYSVKRILRSRFTCATYEKMWNLMVDHELKFEFKKLIIPIKSSRDKIFKARFEEIGFICYTEQDKLRNLYPSGSKQSCKLLCAYINFGKND